MLKSPEISNEQFCLTKPTYVKENKCYKMCFEYLDLKYEDILFKIENCRVRQKIYKDKFVVSHTSTLPSIIMDHCANVLGHTFEKGEPKLLKLKVLSNFKNKNLVEGLETEDVVDIGVKFSECWEYDGKIYPSFKLAFISKKEKSSNTKEDINKYTSMFE